MILGLPSWVFIVDSRESGNDSRFCKGLLDGRGIKGEGENDATYHHNPAIPHRHSRLRGNDLMVDLHGWIWMMCPRRGHCLEASMTGHGASSRPAKVVWSGGDV